MKFPKLAKNTRNIIRENRHSCSKSEEQHWSKDKEKKDIGSKSTSVIQTYLKNFLQFFFSLSTNKICAILKFIFIYFRLFFKILLNQVYHR
jgi:hypothetical protein